MDQAPIDPMFLLGAVLVIAFLALVVMVAVSTRSNTRLHPSEPIAAPEPERDVWEEQLLANTPDAPTPRPAPEVLDRGALDRRHGDFDPSGWDDRPDGYEGTDFGMVGDPDR